MKEARFWEIIDSSRQRAREVERRRNQDFIDFHEQALADALWHLPPVEIVEFNERFWHYHRLAYRWDLWGAAYWLHSGCGDDNFIDFRSCLISLGHKLFFQVLNDPDTLAEIVDQPDAPFMLAEGFQYVAGKVYEEKTGEDIPLARPQETGDRLESPTPKPAGSRFDFDDKDVMRQHFPKILEKFPDGGD